MAFLDNEGSITVDAVLTVSGRKRLAAGDGTFNISAFALGDDEINYSLYNSGHSQGSAYYDLNILKTPILEAFSNTGASLNHKLLTIPDQNLLYLPVLRLNTNASSKGAGDAGKPLAGSPNTDMYVVLCTKNAFDAYKTLPDGFVDGRDAVKASADTQLFTLDQGLDTVSTDQGTWDAPVADDLNENQFIIQTDDRFAKILTPGGGGAAGADAAYSFIDEDNVATYYAVDAAYYQKGYPSLDENASVIAGPRGTRFTFGCRCSAALRNKNTLFTKFGGTIDTFWTNTGANVSSVAGSSAAKFLDSTIRVVGNKTGVALDVPVRFIREDD